MKNDLMKLPRPTISEMTWVWLPLQQKEMSGKRALFLQHVAQTSGMPLGIEVSHASGMYIYDTRGKKYLDFDSGISVSSLGHCHPIVVKAVQRQAETYMHTMVYGEHIQSPQVDYAALLASTLPHGLDSVYFVNSGSEAVEAALKLARKVTGRTEIFSCARAYHGSTIGAESLRSDYDFSRHYFPTVPGVRHIVFNDISQLERITEKTACLILEPVQAEAGIIPATQTYLQAVAARCKETGTLLILDEIQTGFGRTGSLFAFQRYGICPDILLIAKAMGGGMPVGALVASHALMQQFAHNPALGHITTFGGHPVCIAAALATLHILLNETYIQEVETKSQMIVDRLQHPLIQSVRSAGLMIGVELTDAGLVNNVVNEAIAQGVLIDYFLFDDRSFRIAPPLILGEEHIIEGTDKLLHALETVYKNR